MRNERCKYGCYIVSQPFGKMVHAWIASCNECNPSAAMIPPRSPLIRRGGDGSWLPSPPRVSRHLRGNPSRLHVMVTRPSAFQRFRPASGLHLPNGSRLTPVKVSGSDLASQLRQPDRTASRLGKASLSLLIWMIAATFRQPQPTYVDSAQSTCNVNGE